MGWFTHKAAQMVDPDRALPGRTTPIAPPARHAVLGSRLDGPFPAGAEVAVVGMGCFWGAERKFWGLEGVWTTAVGYSGGTTPNPTYEEVCSGLTGHAEVVRVVFDPSRLPYQELLRVFWESHDPTQGLRQGNDVGSQYRSRIEVFSPAQRTIAEESRESYAAALRAARFEREISTEIAEAGPFYFAEPYHQQYLATNPNGYCGLGGTGVSCPVGKSGSGAG